MPHGENVILVLRTASVERVIFKDIAEEIVVMDPTPTLPAEVERIRAAVPDDMQAAVHLHRRVRLLPPIPRRDPARAGSCPRTQFWRDGRRVCPRLPGDRCRTWPSGSPHDLFADEFALSCLNRLQLRNNRQMVDLTDPSAALQLAGTLRNPIAPYAP